MGQRSTPGSSLASLMFAMSSIARDLWMTNWTVPGLKAVASVMTATSIKSVCPTPQVPNTTAAVKRNISKLRFDKCLSEFCYSLDEKCTGSSSNHCIFPMTLNGKICYIWSYIMIGHLPSPSPMQPFGQS